MGEAALNEVCVCGHRHPCDCGCTIFEPLPDLDAFDWGMRFRFGATMRGDQPYPIRSAS